MLFNSEFISIGVLIIGFVVLAYSLLSFAHIRINSADMEQLHKLRLDGVIPSDKHLIADYKSVRAKINYIAPAIYLRQEVWLNIYYYVVRMSLLVRPRSAWFTHELEKMSAHQAVRYRVAMQRLHELQYPGA